MLSRIFGYGQTPKYVGNEDTSESEQTSEMKLNPAEGTLFCSSASDDGSLRQKVMYISCETTVRPTAHQYNYELYVSRAANDITARDDSFPMQLVFPIDKSSCLEAGDVRLGWSDVVGKRYNLEFEDEDTATPLLNAVANALFENVHSRHAQHEDSEQLRKILTPTPELPTSDLVKTEGELFRVSGELYKYDWKSGQFATMVPNVILTINAANDEYNTKGYVMILYRAEDGRRVVETEINNQMNATFYTQSLSFSWVLDLGPEISSDPDCPDCLSVKFEDAEPFVTTRNQLSVCLYEVTHQAGIDDLKVKDEDLKYIENSYRDDLEPMEVDDNDEEEEEERQISEYDPSRRASIGPEDDGLVNSHLAVSANYDRTFVVRGNKMGVFSTNDDGVMFKTTLHFKDQKTGSRFNPSNVLLHEKDHSMIVLDPNDPTKLRRMDLERGEIVDTWSGGLTNNTPIKTVQRANKYANLTDTQEFVGLNKNQLMHMDPRTKEFVVNSKKYAAGTRAKLGCMATTGAGYIAVASENGDIRMFDQIGKNAKTHLPGLGDPIIGIDVSEDGNFVLATTTKYLLIIDTRVKGSEKGGFQKSMGKKKPAPRKLTIRNEDIVKNRMGELNFTTARFNTGSSLERSIVSSTGPFVVVWNFRAVKMGRLDSYKIRRYQDNIIADDFSYDNDGRIVVTLPNDVSVARR